MSHWYGSDDWLWADNTSISWENWASNNDKMTSDNRRCALASGLYPFIWRSDSCFKRRHSLCQYPGGKGRDKVVIEMKFSGSIFEPHLRHYIVSWPQGYKPFSCSTQLSMKFIMPIIVKMPTIVGILTFISMINTTSERLKAKKSYFFPRKVLFFQHFSFYEQ